MIFMSNGASKFLHNDWGSADIDSYTLRSRGPRNSSPENSKLLPSYRPLIVPDKAPVDNVTRAPLSPSPVDMLHFQAL